MTKETTRWIKIFVVVVLFGALPLSVKAMPSESEYNIFEQVSNDKCINILVDTGNSDGNQSYIYNGNVVEVPEGYVKINNVNTGGGRLGLVAWKMPLEGGNGEVIVDGESFGSVLGLQNYNAMATSAPIVSGSDYQLLINENHVAYLRVVDFVLNRPAYASYHGTPVYHLIFDGQDLGQVDGYQMIRLNGDYVIYSKKVNNVTHMFANDRDLGVGIIGDFDGTNKAVMRENGNLYYNGRKLTNQGGSGLSFGSVSLKNGRLAYNKGPDWVPVVYYKGKKMGAGSIPVIEENNLAYFKRPATLVYNKKSYPKVAGANDQLSFSLAGNHFAFMQKINSTSARVNIDGKVYNGGDYEESQSHVTISKKTDCTQ